MSAGTRTIYLGGLLSLVLGFWVYCETVTAQANAPTEPFAVCNIHEAYRKYDKVAKLKRQFEAARNRIREQISEAEGLVKDMRNELELSGFLPGSEEYERSLNNLVKKNIETKNFMDLSQAQLQRRKMQMTKTSYQDIYDAVKKVAERKNIQLVISREDEFLPIQRPEDLIRNIYYRRHVVFSAPEIDITDEVIKQLNGN